MYKKGSLVIDKLPTDLRLAGHNINFITKVYSHYITCIYFLRDKGREIKTTVDEVCPYTNIFIEKDDV